jgi:hypothetical protein
MFVVATVAQAQQDKPDALVSSQNELAESAHSILEDWRAAGDGDERAERPLIITLFTGSDTDPAPQYRERLTRTMRHIQAFYAKEMKRHGFGELTFKLETEEDDLLKIHVVKGDKPNDAYSGKDGQLIRKMVLAQLKEDEIDGGRQTVVIFCNLVKWDPKTRKMSHHSPYYAGGSHQAGTAWQLDSPLLDAAEFANTDKNLYLHDGQYGHISLGRYQSIFIGGVCHELGHALGLPHNKERKDEWQRWGTALMGSGNFTYAQEVRKEGKGSFLTIAHAMKLAAHPAFNGSVKQMRTKPKTKYTQLKTEPTNDGKGVRVSGQIKGDIPVHAVIAYLDPEGNSDYNATTHVAVPDKDGRFTIDCTAFANKPTGRLRLVRVHANGWSQFKEDLGADYTRDDKGVISLEPLDLNQQRTDLLGPMDVYTTHPAGTLCDCCKQR